MSASFGGKLSQFPSVSAFAKKKTTTDTITPSSSSFFFKHTFSLLVCFYRYGGLVLIIFSWFCRSIDTVSDDERRLLAAILGKRNSAWKCIGLAIFLRIGFAFNDIKRKSTRSQCRFSGQCRPMCARQRVVKPKSSLIKNRAFFMEQNQFRRRKKVAIQMKTVQATSRILPILSVYCAPNEADRRRRLKGSSVEKRIRFSIAKGSTE